jgi:hypothetical protein
LPQAALAAGSDNQSLNCRKLNFTQLVLSYAKFSSLVKMHIQVLVLFRSGCSQLPASTQVSSPKGHIGDPVFGMDPPDHAKILTEIKMQAQNLVSSYRMLISSSKVCLRFEGCSVVGKFTGACLEAVTTVCFHCY